MVGVEVGELKVLVKGDEGFTGARVGGDDGRESFRVVVEEFDGVTLMLEELSGDFDSSHAIRCRHSRV